MPLDEQFLEELPNSFRDAGQRHLILRQLCKRFGEVGPGLHARIKALEGRRLAEFGLNVLEFTSLDDAARWGDANASQTRGG